MSKFRELVENILLERILLDIPDDKYAELLKDTSPNGKANAYTKFFGDYLLKNRLHKDEDIAGLTKRHNALYQAGLVKPISDYSDIFELMHDLDNKSNYKTNSEKDKESRSKAKILDNVDGFNLYQITSYDASKKYGAGTKWCTTSSTTRHYFDGYKTKKMDEGWRKLIYAINEQDKKYALVINRCIFDTWFRATIEVYNAEDKISGSYSLQGDGKIDYETDSLSVKYDDVYNYYYTHDRGDGQLVNDFLQWGIKKYKLSKEYMEKQFYDQHPFLFKPYELAANESADGKFYEYSNTDKNAIGFSGVNTYAEKGDSYTMIVDMSPQEFLSLSTVNFVKDDIPWFEEQVKNGVPLAMPYLEIEIEDPKKKIARVYGHEGRHRSLAVSNLGYTQAQCILWIRDFTRAGYKKEDLIGWTIMGQKPRIGNKNTHENNSFVIK